MSPFANSTMNANYWRLGPWWRPGNIDQKRRGLLQILAVGLTASSTRHSATVVEALKVYADEENGFFRNGILRLIARLEDGLPVADALEQTPDLLSDEQVLAIRLAAKSDNLVGCMDELIGSDHTSDDETRSFSPTYLLFVTLIFCLLIAFNKALVVRTFSDIFAEFGMQPTFFFRLLESSWTSYLLVITPIAMFLFVAGRWLLNTLGWARRFRRSMASFLFPSRHETAVAQTLKALAQSLLSGDAVTSSLSTLARFHYDSRVRNQLLYARNELELCTSFADSCREANLLNREEAGALGRLSSPADQGWLLQQIADRSLFDIQQRRRIVLMMIRPAATVVLGIITMIVCLGIFTMLVKIITLLS